ncbi:MAG: NUDIX domain-containing protein [Chloroflexota bacterium]|nr:NUDIX domain-containing protein [Chloroflexota bacterium]
MPSKAEDEIVEDRIRIREVTTLSDDWSVLKKTTLDYRRRDGTWQTLNRETYDRGNGATILPYNRERGSVVLTRQFRYPAYVNGHPDGMLVEACAGLLDRDDPETSIRKEAEEETGYRLDRVEQVFEAYMSPGSVTEKLHFFVAAYEPGAKATAGGGLEADGEEIEVLEVSLTEALAMVGRGEIVDGKTIMLLQYAALSRLLG